MMLRNCLAILLLQWCALASAGELVLTGSESQLDLTPYLGIYQDANASDDLATVAASAVFTPASAALLRPGYTSSALWLKLSLRNSSAASMTRWIRVEPARLQEVSLFVVQHGRWQRLDAGFGKPFSAHPINTVGVVFPIQLAALDSTTIYLRVASQTSINIAVTLWEPLAFREADSKKIIVDSLFLGGLMLTGIYALLMFLSLRERTFALLGLTLIAYCLYEISFTGYGRMFLWQDATLWSSKSILFFGIVTAIFFTVFIRDLLASQSYLPRRNAILNGLLVPLSILLLCIPFVGDRVLTQLSALMGTLVLLVILVTTCMTMRHHFSTIWLYLLALSIVLIGNISRNLMNFGLINSAGWLDYVRPLYMLIGSLFLVAVVLENIKRARKAKDLAQQELLAAYFSYQAKLERDVKDRTADLHAALIETRTANQARSRLLAYISHDLRAPLATIISYVNRLNRDASAQALAYQSTIKHYATHQLELIDDLVEYARGELDQLELHAEPIYLHAWLASITCQAELLAAQYGNRFSAELDAQLPAAVCVDPKRLRQVLLNLLSNAAKFTSAGDIVLRVDMEMLAAPQIAITFTVADTGSGIPHDALERIFQPFERLQSEQQGSGLGLSIAHQIVRNMGSELAVHSTPGQGSRFVFRLVLPTALASEVALPLPADAGLDHFGQGKRILVVDDHAASRDYFLEILAAADFDVVLANDGVAALQRLREHACDAILADQDMPHMDGWALLQQVREHYRAIPVLLCSAMPPRPPAGVAVDLHFDGNLLKPVSQDQLLACMHQLFTPPAMPPATLSERIDAALPSAFTVALQQFIELGSISDIETLTLQLAQDYPEHAVLAGHLHHAAQRIDFAAMAALLAQQR